MEYIRLLKRKLYLGILIILGCALLGSVLGARKESKEPLNGIVQEDIQALQLGSAAPELTGVLPLAANQNNWLNFKFAFAFALAGIVIYCIVIALYKIVYSCKFFVCLRKRLGIGAERNNLFIQ